MGYKIDLRDQPHIGGPDRISERLLIATFRIGGGRQVDPVAMRAGHPRSTLKACVELLRSGRLTEIESLSAHVNSNSDPMIPSHNVAGEERARNCGGAEDGPGTHDSCFGVHVNLLMDPRSSFGSLTTSPRTTNWTPLNRDDGCRGRLAGRRARVRRKFWLPILRWGTHIQGRRGILMRRGGRG